MADVFFLKSINKKIKPSLLKSEGSFLCLKCFYPFDNAAAPLTISESSVVIAA